MLSIIVPVYNVKKYLRQCLDSILNQQFQDFELVLVNDGSTDGSDKICQEYAERYSKVKLINKENGGLVSAWKRGCQESTGEVIGFVDSDDYIKSDYFQNFMNAYAQTGADIVIGGLTKVYNDGREEVSRLKKELLGRAIQGRKLQEIKELLIGGNKLFNNGRCVKIYKRELIINNLNLSNENVRIGEDFCTTLYSVYDAKSITFIENYGYMYRQNDMSMLHKFSKKEINDYVALSDNLVKICEAKNRKGKLNRELAITLNAFMVRILFSSLRVKEKKEQLKALWLTKNAQYVFKNKDYFGLSKKEKIIMKLFGYKCFAILNLIAKVANKDRGMK